MEAQTPNQLNGRPRTWFYDALWHLRQPKKISGPTRYSDSLPTWALAVTMRMGPHPQPWISTTAWCFWCSGWGLVVLPCGQHCQHYEHCSRTRPFSEISRPLTPSDTVWHDTWAGLEHYKSVDVFREPGRFLQAFHLIDSIPRHKKEKEKEKEEEREREGAGSHSWQQFLKFSR